MVTDSYVADIEEKAFGSELLADLARPTLDNRYVRKFSSGRNGINVLQIPDGYVVVGHSSGGDHRIEDPGEYSESVFRKLIGDARSMKIKPIAVASVIDARETEEAFVRAVGEPFARLAQEYGVAIVNGELAKLGDMMGCPCNISATMLGIVKRGQLEEKLEGVIKDGGTNYFIFDPDGKYVWMNSDGIGTKSLIYARMLRHDSWRNSLKDLLAMQLDDKGKFGGGAVASFNVVEASTYPALRHLEKAAESMERAIGIPLIMQYEHVGNRIIGPNGERRVWNASGTLVSLVDEETLRNMPKPQEGDYLIAIKGDGRSNGFTDRRKIMINQFGESWHLNPLGKLYGEFLTKPSIIFYHIFAELIKSGLAKSVYHMSGGAYRDKLSKPISREGLGVEVGFERGAELFAPDPREITLLLTLQVLKQLIQNLQWVMRVL
jgi:phosphoribosylaminoimidazole (AIR) synthetase